MVPLARRNLLAEKGRFALSVAGVAFAVVLVLIVLSLYRGWSGVGAVYSNLPGSLWVSQPGTSDPYHSTSFLPATDAKVLARVPGVRAALPVYTRHIAFGRKGHELDVFAIALATSERGVTPPVGTIDVDRVLSARLHVHVGGTIDVLGRRLVVSHVHTGGNSIFQTAYLNAVDARRLFAIDGLTNFFLLQLAPDASTAAVASAVAARLPGTETHTEHEFVTSFAGEVNAGFLAVVGVLVGIGVVVGGAVIALTTYTATLEKAREYGVLKAIGAPAGYLYRIVLEQSLIVGVLGSTVGITASVVATRTIEGRVPEFITDLRLADAALVFGGALATAIAASYVPVRRIERIDPAEVFRP